MPLSTGRTHTHTHFDRELSLCRTKEAAGSSVDETKCERECVEVEGGGKGGWGRRMEGWGGARANRCCVSLSARLADKVL